MAEIDRILSETIVEWARNSWLRPINWRPDTVQDRERDTKALLINHVRLTSVIAGVRPHLAAEHPV